MFVTLIFTTEPLPYLIIFLGIGRRWDVIRTYIPAIPSLFPSSNATVDLCSEGTNNRALPSASYTDNAAMTDESCIAYCNGKGYIYVGVEYSSQCCKLHFL